MSKSSNISTAHTHLHKALVALSDLNESQETKTMIIKAMKSLEETAAKHVEKKQNNQTQHEQWWGQIVAGAVKASFAKEAQAPFAKEAQMKKIKMLDQLIEKQQKAIDEMESDAGKQIVKTQILNE